MGKRGGGDARGLVGQKFGEMWGSGAKRQWQRCEKTFSLLIILRINPFKEFRGLNPGDIKLLIYP